jgi:hypothetical protein
VCHEKDLKDFGLDFCVKGFQETCVLSLAILFSFFSIRYMGG